MKGKIIKLSHLVVVPHTQTSDGWLCVVVESRHPSHPVGGLDVCVGDVELGLGVELIPTRRETATKSTPRKRR